MCILCDMAPCAVGPQRSHCGLADACDASLFPSLLLLFLYARICRCGFVAHIHLDMHLVVYDVNVFMAPREARSNSSVRTDEPWRINPPPPPPPGQQGPGGRLGPTADDEMVRLILRRARVAHTIPVGYSSWTCNPSLRTYQRFCFCEYVTCSRAHRGVSPFGSFGWYSLAMGEEAQPWYIRFVGFIRVARRSEGLGRLRA